MLHRHLRIHQILGAGTDVGKTIFATALCRASVAAGEKVAYLKPIGTGSGNSGVGDDGHVKTHAGRDVETSCLYFFNEPVSPHLAAQRAKASVGKGKGKAVEAPTDEELVGAISARLQACAESAGSRSAAAYVEAAGGVHSPVLSGTSTLRALRPLRLPTVLVGSPQLGGISSTVSAYESLLLHGFSVDALLVLREEKYANWDYLRSWAREKGLFVGVMDVPPAPKPSKDEERKSMSEYYDRVCAPATPDRNGAAGVVDVVEHLKRHHARRLENLDTLPRRALDQVWWPFVQHSHVADEDQVTVIDSAEADCFASSRGPPPSPHSPILSPTFDGSASWWTQTLGHSHPDLSLAAAHAAGRYGHVLFPNCAHEPAVDLTERLLQGPGRGWASRVFFSDDGSTGTEVAIKMALAGYARRFGLPLPNQARAGRPLGVLGLKGSYHGDTIGAMDASEASVYNAQVHWYDPKGFWLEAPTVQLRRREDGGAGVEAVVEAEGLQWATSSVLGAWWQRRFSGGLPDVYDVESRLRRDPLAASYRQHLQQTLDEATSKGAAFQIAALIMEPIVMGAGGMLFVDPLFQRVLIDLVRSEPDRFRPLVTGLAEDGAGMGVGGGGAGEEWVGLPVIFDEVFSGLRRLGPLSAARLLGDDVHPDVAVYAKILTAGTVPMGVTLATDAIFQTFKGDTKAEALLHGHSYTAHPVGCAVANKGFELVERMERAGAWDAAKKDWATSSSVVGGGANGGEGPWSSWSRSVVEKLATADGVDGAMALGTVLAVYLRDSAGGGGYTSGAAAGLVDRLDEVGRLAGGLRVHARPLGNVAYLMASLTTSRQTLAQVEAQLLDALTP